VRIAADWVETVVVVDIVVALQTVVRLVDQAVVVVVEQTVVADQTAVVPAAVQTAARTAVAAVADTVAGRCRGEGPKEQTAVLRRAGDPAATRCEPSRACPPKWQPRTSQTRPEKQRER
jgi:hypothetical protein